MNDIVRIENNRRMSRAVVHNNIVWVAGTTAPDSNTDVRGQSRQIFEKIDKLLAQAGTGKHKLLSAEIWLQDIERDFDAMNESWDEWVDGAGPARATVQAKLARPGLLVEIKVVAAV